MKCIVDLYVNFKISFFVRFCATYFVCVDDIYSNQRLFAVVINNITWNSLWNCWLFILRILCKTNVGKKCKKENYRYSISGLTQGYEAGEYAPNAFGKVLGSIFNPADMLYNFFGKNGKELKKLKEMKKDDTVRTLLESKYDRETVAVLLGISKDEIPEIMHRCNYSDSFIQTANDLQIMDAISACYEQYKVLKRN